MLTYTAALATGRSVVSGDHCDVSVVENKIVAYREEANGAEVPEYEMTDKVAMEAAELAVRVDDLDALAKAPGLAEKALREAGWRLVGGWEVAPDALYAPVEPT